MKRNRKRLVGAVLALAGLGGSAVAAHAATFADDVLAPVPPAAFPAIASTCSISPCSVDLVAGPGSVTVKDTTAVGGTQDVPFLGFGVNGAPVALAGSANSTIKIAEGTTVTIHFSQSGIADPVRLSFPSLPAGAVSQSGNDYTFTASAGMVGTSVFQPGTNSAAPRQVAMGLVGVLIVTPAACASTTLSCAYDGTAYSDEALIATTDLDLAFATDFAAGGHAFSMGYFGQSPNPDGTPRKVYHVLDGKSFPDTDVIDVHAGDSVLFRTVNAGVSDKSMSLLGIRQTLLGRNASAYTDPQTFIAPLVGPGETADVAVQVPGTALAGQRYALIDAGRQMNHGNSYGFGGALTFLNVWPASVPVVEVPTVDTLTAAAGVTTSPSVTVGNPLIDRAYATDYPDHPAGTPSPVLVALTSAPLPAGTLTTFKTWNQADTVPPSVSGPSAGGLLHAYVLHPTGTADQYKVIYDSGELTVPALTDPTVSEGFEFSPVGGVTVQAGDVIAYYGDGVPVDVGGGSDVLVYDLTTPVVAPAADQVITLGATGYPIYSTDRTYSFAATVTPTSYTGSTALTAAGHSSGATHNVTGYQTIVNSGTTPVDADWPATTTSIAVPAATVPIAATVSAVPGQTVWIRVQQDGTVWSNPASIVVPVP